MAIVRTPKSKNYAVIDNRVLTDRRLSWRARGVMGYLLSKPDGWEVMKQNLINESPDGRKIVEATLRELESYGYIEHGEQPRGEGGRFDAVATIVHEEPLSGFPTKEGRNAKPQFAPMAKRYNGEEDQVYTVVPLPRAVEPRTVERIAVEVPREKTEVSITEEPKTEGPRRSAVSASENPQHPEDDLDRDLLIATAALMDSMSLLWPDQTRGQVYFRIGQVTERFKDAGGSEEVPYALAALSDRLQRRAELIAMGKAEPTQGPKFMLGMADQIIGCFNRNDGWVGATYPNLVEGWDDFLFDYEHLHEPSTAEAS
jgi:hypothetical protein